MRAHASGGGPTMRDLIVLKVTRPHAVRDRFSASDIYIYIYHFFLLVRAQARTVPWSNIYIFKHKYVIVTCPHAGPLLGWARPTYGL